MKNCPYDENSTGRTECCLSKIEKLAKSARVALLQSTNILVGDLGASVHYTNIETAIYMKVVGQVL